MSDGLIPSFKPQNLIEAKAPRQRQSVLISQRATDRIAIAQEAFRWAEKYGPNYGLKVLKRLDKPQCKTDFTKTVTEFLIRLYELKLEHEVIFTILKLIALLLIAGLLYVRQQYRSPRAGAVHKRPQRIALLLTIRIYNLGC